MQQIRSSTKFSVVPFAEIELVQRIKQAKDKKLRFNHQRIHLFTESTQMYQKGRSNHQSIPTCETDQQPR